MFNRAPSLGRLTLALLCLAVLVGSLFIARCRPYSQALGLPSQAPKAEAMAQVTMVNGSPCEWLVVFTSMANGERHSWKLPLSNSVDAKFVGGDYAIEQTMLADETSAEATRRFTMRLEPGLSYRWRLMTLLSEQADVPEGGKTKASHE